MVPSLSLCMWDTTYWRLSMVTDLRAESEEFTLCSSKNSLCVPCFQTNMYLQRYRLKSKSTFITSDKQKTGPGGLISHSSIMCYCLYQQEQNVWAFLLMIFIFLMHRFISKKYLLLLPTKPHSAELIAQETAVTLKRTPSAFVVCSCNAYLSYFCFAVCVCVLDVSSVKIQQLLYYQISTISPAVFSLVCHQITNWFHGLLCSYSKSWAMSAEVSPLTCSLVMFLRVVH